MVGLLAHITVNRGKSAHFETLAREVSDYASTREPGCIRYEIWRAPHEDKYLAIMIFENAASFYAHQGSDCHKRLMPEFIACLKSVEFDFIDPVKGASGDFPPTVAVSLDRHSGEELLAQESAYPIIQPAWWEYLRSLPISVD